MAPNQNYSWQQYASGGDDAEAFATYFREQAIERVLEDRKRAKLGYPTAAEPTQAVTPAEIPAQTGERPEPPIAGREEMLAANIKRAMGRDRLMLGGAIPGSLSQEQFVKELEGVKTMAPSFQAGGAADAEVGNYSEILGEAKSVYDPEQGRFVTKWNLGKIDPRYGYQSAEAIESYLGRPEPQVSASPRQVSAAAVRQAPVTPAPARAAAPAAMGAAPRKDLTPGELFMQIAKEKYERKDLTPAQQKAVYDVFSGRTRRAASQLYR
jgi:hypothetical protein